MDITQVDVIVTHQTVGSTEFEVGHHFLCRSHPILVNDTPSQRYRGEVTPAVLLVEFGRCVCTEGQRSIIAAGIVIIETTDERQHIVIRIDVGVGYIILSRTQMLEYGLARQFGIKTVALDRTELTLTDDDFFGGKHSNE